MEKRSICNFLNHTLSHTCLGVESYPLHWKLHHRQSLAKELPSRKVILKFSYPNRKIPLQGFLLGAKGPEKNHPNSEKKQKKALKKSPPILPYFQINPSIGTSCRQIISGHKENSRAFLRHDGNINGPKATVEEFPRFGEETRCPHWHLTYLPLIGPFEDDDCHFPKARYVIVPWRVKQENPKKRCGNFKNASSSSCGISSSKQTAMFIFSIQSAGFVLNWQLIGNCLHKKISIHLLQIDFRKPF